MTVFIVQEFTAGKWFSLRLFATRTEAEDFAARFPKSRIVTKVR